MKDIIYIRIYSRHIYFNFKYICIYINNIYYHNTKYFLSLKTILITNTDSIRTHATSVDTLFNCIESLSNLKLDTSIKQQLLLR